MTEVILHYTYFIYLVFTSKPENNVVTGLHEPVGPCNVTEPVKTPFGHVSKLGKLNFIFKACAIFDMIPLPPLPHSLGTRK